MLDLMRSPIRMPLTANGDQSGQRGYTLVEMLIVVAIVGMIVVIAIPNLRRAQVRADLLEEVRMLSQAMALSRIHAVKNSRRVIMYLLNGTGAPPGNVVIAWVENSDPPNESWEAEDEVIGRWSLKTNTTLGVDSDNLLHILTSPQRGIVFLPNGTSIASSTGDIGVGTGAVVIADRHNNQIRLLVQAGAGTITRQMWNPDSPDADKWDNDIRFWRY